MGVLNHQIKLGRLIHAIEKRKGGRKDEPMDRGKEAQQEKNPSFRKWMGRLWLRAFVILHSLELKLKKFEKQAYGIALLRRAILPGHFIWFGWVR